VDLGHAALGRALASKGRGAAARVQPPPKLRRRQAIVTAVSGGGKYAQVTLNNSTQVSPFLVVNPAYIPSVGDYCWVLLNGHGICDMQVDSQVVNPGYTVTLP
jgi:hypothetical protein